MSKKQQQPEPGTALTVVERAAIAVRSTPELKQELVELAQGSKHITTITNPDGRAQVHSALMALKNRRVDIEKIGKAAREDATAFRNAVIAEEDALVGLIQPEEERLQAIRDEWDERIEAERQAKVQAEKERQQAIQNRIAAIRGTVQAAAMCTTAADIATYLDVVDRAVISPELFEESLDIAADTKAQAYEQLSKMHQAAVAREAEAARLAEERAELERLRAEQAERELVADNIRRGLDELRANPLLTVASGTKAISAEMLRIAALHPAPHMYGDRLQEALSLQVATLKSLEELHGAAKNYEAEQARLAEQRAAQEAESARIRKEREDLEAAQRAEQQRKDREEQARREEEARQTREREEREAAEAAERARQEKHDFVPTLRDVVKVLCETYDQSEERVMEWLPGLVKVTKRKAA